MSGHFHQHDAQLALRSYIVRLSKRVCNVAHGLFNTAPSYSVCQLTTANFKSLPQSVDFSNPNYGSRSNNSTFAVRWDNAAAAAGSAASPLP